MNRARLVVSTHNPDLGVTVTGVTPAEGWYKDPYGRFDARWISAGRPTRLVRRGHEEMDDEPPEGPPPTVFEPLDPPTGDSHGTDLLRADDEDRDHESMGAVASRAADQVMWNR